MTRTAERPSETRAAQAPLHAERLLLDGLARILRNQGPKQGWCLLALQLSRIPPPGPRSHHRRVAAAVLDDAAGRTSGQLFALANGDMALLFRPNDEGEAVGTSLARLFQADVPDPATLRTIWSLPEDSAPALDWVRERVTDPSVRPPEPEQQGNAAVIAALEEQVRTLSVQDIAHRQTAVLIRPGKADRIIPLFREVSISTPLIEARVTVSGQAAADPFLFSHLAAHLDRRMLVALLQDLPAHGPLSGGLHVAALHVNMTLTGILSEAFAAFAEACRAAIADGLRVAIEIPFVEVFADPAAFLIARERLKLAKLRMVLDGVTQHALTVSNPGLLHPHLVKLDWSPALQDTGPELRAAIERLGPERVVLHRCSDDAALSWGLSRGIQRFQGHFVDNMLATERLRACPRAAACTLRQCRQRSTAAGSGRNDCTNLRLLDLGVPLRALAAA